MERIEKAIRRVEQAVRDHDEKRWASSNPEAAARAQSLVDQLETAVKGLRKDLEKAEAAGNAKKIADARSDLAAREQWLAQARAGVEEFGSGYGGGSPVGRRGVVPVGLPPVIR